MRARPDLPATFAVKLSAQDDAVRERVALGYRSEVEYYARVADRMSIPVPPCFYSDISDDGADFVLVLADMAPAVQGDQIARMQRVRKRASRWRRSPACTARAGATPSGWSWPGSPCRSPATTPRRADLARSRQMAAGILVDKLGDDISDEDKETLTAAMSLVTPWLKAEPEQIRPHARRLPARQHAVRSRSHPHHRRGLADGRHRAARQGPRVLHRDQPRPRRRVRKSSTISSASTTRRYSVTA